MRDAIRRGAAANEVQKHEEKLTGAWRQMSTRAQEQRGARTENLPCKRRMGTSTVLSTMEWQHVCYLFRQRFSAAYLLKLFLLPQRAHTTLFNRCDKPELTRWCLCSLHAGIQMSPDEVVGSRYSKGTKGNAMISTLQCFMKIVYGIGGQMA